MMTIFPIFKYIQFHSCHPIISTLPFHCLQQFQYPLSKPPLILHSITLKVTIKHRRYLHCIRRKRCPPKTSSYGFYTDITPYGLRQFTSFHYADVTLTPVSNSLYRTGTAKKSPIAIIEYKRMESSSV